MSGWWDDLIGKHNVPAVGGGGKPVSPVSPFPTLPLSAVRDQRWDNRLRRYLGSTLQPQVVDYLQILHGVLALNQFNPEDYYPDELLYIGGTDPTAAGGQITQGMLRNPKGSGVLLVVEELVLSQATLANFFSMAYYGPGVVDLANIQASAPRDTRYGVISAASAGVGILSQQAAAGVSQPGILTNAFSVQNLPITGPLPPLKRHITLVPDSALTWFTTTQGVQQTFVDWLWRQRPLAVVPG